MTPFLKASELNVSFQTTQGIFYPVNGVSFDILPGETRGIVGESGSGKTLTALSLIGLLPQNAKATGSLIFNGKELLGQSEQSWRKIRREQIRMIFQDPMSSLNPTMTIGQHLALSLSSNKKYLELLEEVGITNPEQKLRCYPHQISGGQRQRVMIAMALSSDPKMLIADEPTTALDVTTQGQIADLLQRVQEKRKMSILLITHDFTFASRLAKRLIVMYGGKTVEEALTTDLLRHPKHPYTQALLKSIPSIHQKQNELTVIQGSPPTLLTHFEGCAFAPRCSNAMKICSVKSPPLKQICENHTSACWSNQL